MEENEVFYAGYHEIFERTKTDLEQSLRLHCSEKMEHLKVRLKSKQSVIQKLERLHCEIGVESALLHLNDLVGVRIVCRFLSDVYELATAIEAGAASSHIISKDYIRNPKPNGYRSYHILLKIRTGDVDVPVEIQLRTISQDSWASLEHKMKYKKEIQNAALIKAELKRLADEMASGDICMQTIRDLICENTGEDTTQRRESLFFE